jgi:hemolysin III
VNKACIYLLIAGSYTPFTLVPLKNSVGWELLWTVWVIAGIGIIFKIFAINRFKLLSVLAYVGMGWLVMWHFSSLIDNLSLISMALLMTGGLAYTLGTLFYVWDSLPYNHAIWHVFVLAGSACHYFSIMHLI